MASEWALMRALAAVDVLGPKPGGSWSKTVEKIAAALDEARADGAERERWANHGQAATQAEEHHRADYHNEAKAIGIVRDLIAARGPMRGPEEE